MCDVGDRPVVYSMASVVLDRMADVSPSRSSR
jgi:hypothetical protein